MPFEYASLAEVKQGNAIKTNPDDAWLTVLIQSASQAINNYCGRPDGFKADGQADAREFVGTGKSILWFNGMEAAAIELVEVKDSPTDADYVVWEATDWRGGRGDPRHGVFGDQPFRPYQWITTRLSGHYATFTSGRVHGLRGFTPDPDGPEDHGEPTVRITANWGYSLDTPPAVKQATIQQVGRWYSRGKSGFADTSVTPEFGVTVFRRSFETLDQDIAMILIMGKLVKQSV